MKTMTSTTGSSSSLLEQENKLLLALSLHVKSLQVAKVENVKPGTALYYPLGDTYGIHIVRGAQDVKEGHQYKDAAGLRAGVEAGNFLILPEDV